MGAYASILQVTATLDLVAPDSWSDPSTKELWTRVNEKEGLICDTERAVLLTQIKVMFRKHDDIIRIIMSKTKKQLLRLVQGELTPQVVESLGGGPYAKFLKQVCLSPHDALAAELDIAIGGVGCHEEGLVIATTTVDTPTLAALVAAHKGKKDDFCFMINGKTKRGSPLQKFLLRIQHGDRDGEDLAVDSDLASAQAQQLHAHGAANSFGVKEDPIIEILARASRNQCVAISTAYMKLNSMTLTAALQTKFSGAAMIGMCMWVLPIPDALAFLFNYLASSSSDASIAARVLARYEKPFLKTIDEACRRNHEKGLYNLLEKNLSGNLAKAVLAWINSPSPDGGNEFAFDAIIQEKLVAQRDLGLQPLLFSVVGNPETCARLREILDKTEVSLDKYMAMCMPEVVVAAPVPMLGAAKHASRESLRYKVSGKGSAPMLVSLGENFEMSFSSNLNMIEDYLHAQFHVWDPVCVGSLPADKFWQFFAALPLADFGYTPEEVTSFQNFVDWEHDGMVCFDEIKDELADSIIDSLHEKKVDIKKTFDALHTTMSGPEGSTGCLPPDLLGYLQTTFESYDLDSSGELEWEEFWQFVNAMNIGISEFDFVRVQGEWDEDHDGGISWREALKKLVVIISKLMSSRQDYWIGLVDKDSKMLFWYNLRDQSSQWMNEDDQIAFRAHALSEEQAAADAVAEAAAVRKRRGAAQPVNPMIVKRRSFVAKRQSA